MDDWLRGGMEVGAVPSPSDIVLFIKLYSQVAGVDSTGLPFA